MSGSKRRAGKGRLSLPPAYVYNAIDKNYKRTVYSFVFLLNTDQRLELKVGRIIGDRQNPHRVGVAKAALPALDSNDRAASLDQTQFQTSPQAISDAIVHLSTQNMSADSCFPSWEELYSHPSATGGSRCPWVRGTIQGNKPCASEADERSVRYE